jgi:hypothetical protein
MQVSLAADVSSLADVTETVLAAALVGKLGGADASAPSTIRKFVVVVVSGRRLSTTSTSSTSSGSSGSSGSQQGGPSSAAAPLLPLAALPSELDSSPEAAQDGALQVALLRPRALGSSLSVNVTFEVAGSLKELGYQNADAFEVYLIPPFSSFFFSSLIPSFFLPTFSPFFFFIHPYSVRLPQSHFCFHLIFFLCFGVLCFGVFLCYLCPKSHWLPTAFHS